MDAVAAGRRARLEIPVDAAGRLAVSVAVAGGLEAMESLSVTGADGQQVAHHVLELDRGTRVHVVSAPVGALSVAYEGTIDLGKPDDEAVSEADRFH